MKSRTLHIVTCLLMATSVVTQASSLSGDSDYLGVQFLRPSYNDERRGSSSVFFVSGRLATSETTRLELGVPISRWSSEFIPSDTALGNLYLGLETRQIDDGYGVDFGVWLPTAPDDGGSATFSGLYADLNRWESFLPNVASARLGLSFWQLSPRGLGARVRLAPSIMVPTEGEGDPELFGMYSAHVVYQGERAEVSGGLLGRLWINDDRDSSERNSHQLEVEATLKAQAARVGVFVFVPVDEGMLADVVDYVLGFQVGAALR